MPEADARLCGLFCKRQAAGHSDQPKGPLATTWGLVRGKRFAPSSAPSPPHVLSLSLLLFREFVRSNV